MKITPEHISAALEIYHRHKQGNHLYHTAELVVLADAEELLQTHHLVRSPLWMPHDLKSPEVKGIINFTNIVASGTAYTVEAGPGVYYYWAIPFGGLDEVSEELTALTRPVKWEIVT